MQPKPQWAGTPAGPTLQGGALASGVANGQMGVPCSHAKKVHLPLRHQLGPLAIGGAAIGAGIGLVTGIIAATQHKEDDYTPHPFHAPGNTQATRIAAQETGAPPSSAAASSSADAARPAPSASASASASAPTAGGKRKAIEAAMAELSDADEQSPAVPAKLAPIFTTKKQAV